MASNRSLKNLAFEALTKQGLLSIPGENINSISEVNITTLVEELIIDNLLPRFLQAVIDDNRKHVLELLERCPQLLLIEPKGGWVIESQLTWQKFNAEKAFTMATYRNQFEMIKLLCPYFIKLQQLGFIADAKAEISAQWKNLNIDLTNLPMEYILFIQWLIDIFLKENFPNGASFEPHNKLSNETEEALKLFRKITLPQSPIKMDDQLDIELLLYIAYGLYSDNLIKWVNLQGSFFYVRVIGFLQSLLIPETAKMICQGLHSIVRKEEISISEKAESLKLEKDEFFYRSSKESLGGLAGNYAVSLFGPIQTQYIIGRGRTAESLFKDFILQKNAKLVALRPKQ